MRRKNRFRSGHIPHHGVLLLQLALLALRLLQIIGLDENAVAVVALAMGEFVVGDLAVHQKLEPLGGGENTHVRAAVLRRVVVECAPQVAVLLPQQVLQLLLFL